MTERKTKREQAIDAVTLLRLEKGRDELENWLEVEFPRNFDDNYVDMGSDFCEWILSFKGNTL